MAVAAEGTGRVERRILEELASHGGCVPRTVLLHAVLAERAPARSDPEGAQAGGTAARRRRAAAEATVTRAIRSLERRGLVVRERDGGDRRTIVRSTDLGAIPLWEDLARAEEDLADYCRRMIGRWRGLCNRARRRSEVIRTERTDAATADERKVDLDIIEGLESSAVRGRSRRIP